MKKSIILAIVITGLNSIVSFAGWPFGNIGLNVDHAYGQLDVGGTTILRDSLVEIGGNDNWWIGELENMPPHGLYIANDSQGTIGGFAFDGDCDEIAGFNVKRFHTDWLEIVDEDYHYRICPKQIHFTNCVDGAETSIYIESDEVTVYLENSDNSIADGKITGGRLNIDSWTANPETPKIVKIIGDRKATNGNPIRIAIGDVEWISLSDYDMLYLELLYTPQFGTYEHGFWQVIKATNKDNENPIDEFLTGSDRFIYEDGSDVW